MPGIEIKQLQGESESWKRVLRYMSDENILLKYRLSEMLKGKFDMDILNKAEGFQNSFLREDAFIGLLRNDVLEFEKQLNQELNSDHDLNSDILDKQNTIRATLKAAEKHFNKLKAEFNNYLLEYL